jgi:hypothetical protein
MDTGWTISFMGERVKKWGRSRERKCLRIRKRKRRKIRE